MMWENVVMIYGNINAISVWSTYPQPCSTLHRYNAWSIFNRQQHKKGTGEPKMLKKVEIKWFSEPEEHNYPAALSYLCLLYNEQTAATLVDKLKRASIAEFKAKDIFRASGLSLLGISNAHVEKNQQKIQSGHQLSPLLLIRDSVNRKIIVWDGYHQLCAVYSYDEDAVIPCKIT
jgi:hypothetical protein